MGRPHSSPSPVPKFAIFVAISSFFFFFLNQWLEGLFAITPHLQWKLLTWEERGRVMTGKGIETKYLINFFPGHAFFPFLWQMKARIVTLCLSRTKFQIGHISCDFQSNIGNHKEYISKCQDSCCCAQTPKSDYQ